MAANGIGKREIGEALGLSVRTIEGHFNSILNKLGAASRTEALLHTLSKGWIKPEQDEL